MERLLIDFSHVYGQNGTRQTARSVYSTYADSPRNKETPAVSFEDMLSDSIKKVNTLQLDAEKKIRDLSIGDAEDISEVVLASSRADTALRLVMEIRNKFLDAYQALSRITG
ncbi:MAG: flagellar hook-basal body complex protein FliE [Synergistaceae bacterium]|nr:flagellar hook-basal body complex protein FliE [Synergistaceae bacterium]MBR0257720.1 flagellar hook-basal body complex protein FliE [Synergistaceae bacterium]